jgi:hypothetical protein
MIADGICSRHLSSPTESKIIPWRCEFKVHPFTQESCTVQTRAFIHQITCEGIHAAVATGTPEERSSGLPLLQPQHQQHTPSVRPG